ncbi:MAG TPA: DUF4175 family protein, partial [Tepidisphaeraceae bacterium]
MQSTDAIQLPDRITDLLKGFVVRRRRVEAARSVGRAILLGALWLAAWGVADRFISLPAVARLMLLIASTVLLGGTIAPTVLSFFRRHIDYCAAARQIELRHPKLFREALATVVSVRAREKGSSPLVEQLTRDVEERIAAEHQHLDLRRLVPVRPAARAWAAALVAVLILLNLCVAWPWLDFSRLLARQLMPLAGGLHPVTSTRLELLTPGSAEIVQGRAFPVTVRAEPPAAAASVVLRTTSDGQRWSAIPMTVAPDGSLHHTLPAINRDLTWEITAGDSVIGPYTIRVLHRPIVRELRIRLTYPPAVGREPLEIIASEDSTIDVPAGTVTQISIVATEPLSDASLTFADSEERIGSIATSDSHIRTSQVQIDRDSHLQIELLSDHDVLGSSAGELMFRAIPDRAPVARFLTIEPSKPLLLKPDEVLEIPYQAADDFGLAELSVHIGLNDRAPTTRPLPMAPESRRSEGVYKLD